MPAAKDPFSEPWVIAFLPCAFPEIAPLIIPTVPDIAAVIPTSGFSKAAAKLSDIFFIPPIAFPISPIPSRPCIPLAIPAIPSMPTAVPIAPNISLPIPLDIIEALIAPVITPVILPIIPGFSARVSKAAVAAPTGNASRAPAIIDGDIPISATFIDAKLPASKFPISNVFAPAIDSISTIPAFAKPSIAVPIPIPLPSKFPIIPFASKPAVPTAFICPANFCIAITFPAPI